MNSDEKEWKSRTNAQTKMLQSKSKGDQSSLNQFRKARPDFIMTGNLKLESGRYMEKQDSWVTLNKDLEINVSVKDIQVGNYKI